MEPIVSIKRQKQHKVWCRIFWWRRIVPAKHDRTFYDWRLADLQCPCCNGFFTEESIFVDTSTFTGRVKSWFVRHP